MQNTLRHPQNTSLPPQEIDSSTGAIHRPAQKPAETRCSIRAGVSPHGKEEKAEQGSYPGDYGGGQSSSPVWLLWLLRGFSCSVHAFRQHETTANSAARSARCEFGTRPGIMQETSSARLRHRQEMHGRGGQGLALPLPAAHTHSAISSGRSRHEDGTTVADQRL